MWMGKETEFYDSDSRRYSVEVCENGIEVVFVKNPEEKTISVVTMAGWGYDGVDSFLNQVRVFIGSHREIQGPNVWRA